MGKTNNTNISETKTENLFRKFYGATTFIEKTAIPSSYGFKSKKGTKYKGYPDFFKDCGDYVIIVEAKATDISQAEDEALYYCLNNKIRKQKDIIGIAFAGQTKTSLKITQFLLTTGNDKPTDLGKSKNFQSLKDIENIYENKKYGDLLTDEQLSIILSGINKFLNDNSIRDTDRSLFFSAIMIALRNDNFRNTYRNIIAPTDSERSTTKINLLDSHYLNKAILDSVNIELKDKINSLSKEYSWIDRFSFIKTVDLPLDKYIDLIKEIENKIYRPFRKNQKQDILGKAYKMFLSRSGKIDNKNIILTPDHIKKLMVDLARITLDDVVLDTCTGSGGFLMEAMERMTAQAKGDKKILKEIHEQKLIGFETDIVLFALACSNMFLHGDGRTNMLYRSSLLKEGNKQDNILFKHIKKLKPTKVIINPPYENNNPILFTDQAIDFLEPNGKLIIIMPSPTLQQNMNGLTEKILQKAKLDFVIKLPVDIFKEQNRTVYTSIFGFTKTPHQKNDNVLFYYLEKDGLVSIQHKGRIDKFNKWDNIERHIVNTVLNNKQVSGISKTKKIYKNDILNCYGYQNIKKSKYDMVEFGKLFNIEKGTVASQDAIDGDYILMTAGDEKRTCDEFTHNCEAITYAVGAGGSLGKAHYVKGKFSASNLCLILTEKDKIKYPINMQFYEMFLTQMRNDVIFDVADGTSKLTIDDKRLLLYKIPYVPISVQNDFYKKHINKIKRMKKTYEKEVVKLNDIIDKLK